MRLYTCCRGQAIIESLVMLSVLIFTLSVGLYVVLHVMTKIWITYSFQERLYCELAAEKNCAINMSAKMDLLTWGKLTQQEFKTEYNRKFYKKITGKILWKYTKIQSATFTPGITLRMTIAEKDLRDSLWSASSH